MSLVEIKNMALKIGDDTLFEIDDFNLEKGEVAIIIGNNGSGKSTLLKKLFSLLRDDDIYATISKVDEKKDLVAKLNCSEATIDLSGNSKIRPEDQYKSFVYIGQDEYYVNKDSVIQSLKAPTEAAIDAIGRCVDYNELVKEYALKYLSDIYKFDKEYKKKFDKKYEKAKKKGQSESDLKGSIAEYLLKKKKTAQCSGGQKKMISVLAGLIRAKVVGVDLIVIDEPLNHLDHAHKLAISELLNRLLKEENFALIMVSHCLVFDFIKEDTTTQYVIKEKHLCKLEKEEKIFHDCLQMEQVKS